MESSADDGSERHRSPTVNCLESPSSPTVGLSSPSRLESSGRLRHSRTHSLSWMAPSISPTEGPVLESPSGPQHDDKQHYQDHKSAPNRIRSLFLPNSCKPNVSETQDQLAKAAEQHDETIEWFVDCNNRLESLLDAAKPVEESQANEMQDIKQKAAANERELRDQLTSRDADILRWLDLLVESKRSAKAMKETLTGQARHIDMLVQQDLELREIVVRKERARKKLLAAKAGREKDLDAVRTQLGTVQDHLARLGREEAHRRTEMTRLKTRLELVACSSFTVFCCGAGGAVVAYLVWCALGKKVFLIGAVIALPFYLWYVLMQVWTKYLTN